METYKTFCRNCVGGCGLEVSVSEGRIAGVRSDRDNAASNGYACIKAAMSTDLANGAEDRLMQSLRRQPDGSFTPIAGAAAIEQIGDKLRAIVDQYGPRSVALYFGSGAYANSLAVPVAKAFMHEVGSPNWFSSMTIDQSAIWVTMLRMGFMMSGKYEIEELDVLMIIGNNPLVSHQHLAKNPGKSLRGFRKRGGKLIVIDPRQTETARLADLHVQVIPGQDVSLLASMINVIIANDWYDQEFCGRLVDGVAELREATAAYEPQAVAERCGVPASQIIEAARIFSAGRGRTQTATGPCMGEHSNLAHHLVETLDALCGNYRRAGEPVLTPGVLMPHPVFEGVVPAFRSWEEGVKCRSVDCGKIMGEFPTAALPDEILMPGEGKIRALIAFGGNPIKALGQPEKTLRAFDDLDLLVTIDARMTDTAARSDYVLAAALQYEREDLHLIAEVTYYEFPFAQYTPAVVEAPGETLHELDIFWGIARQMGLQLEYRKLRFGMGYEHAAPGHPMDMTTPPDREQLVRWWCEGTVVDIDLLKRHPSGLKLNLPPAVVAPGDPEGPKLQICPPDVFHELHDAAQENAPVEGYPYRLAVRRLLQAINGAFHDTKATRALYPTNFIFMNPDDMAAESLTDGERVEIASRDGMIVGHAKTDRGLRRGVISIPHMWGFIDKEKVTADGFMEAFTGRLISIDRQFDPINRMPVQTGIPLRVRRVESIQPESIHA